MIYMKNNWYLYYKHAKLKVTLRNSSQVLYIFIKPDVSQSAIYYASVWPHIQECPT